MPSILKSSEFAIRDGSRPWSLRRRGNTKHPTSLAVGEHRRTRDHDGVLGSLLKVTVPRTGSTFCSSTFMVSRSGGVTPARTVEAGVGMPEGTVWRPRGWPSTRLCPAYAGGQRHVRPARHGHEHLWIR